MVLKRKHKIIIGGVSSLLLIFMITSTIFMYMMFTKQNTDYNLLSQKIANLQTDTQVKLNDLSSSLLDTENNLKTVNSQLGSLDSELVKLKASASSDFSGIIEDAVKSVVTIKTDLGQGSGFIISSGGYVVTNEHVIDGATAATAITYEGKTHSVTLVGKNVKMDIALLKINEATTYSPLILTDSDNIQVGEKVIAIGNPLGLQFSVSEGIVSAVHRMGDNKINAYIQTDASLNPGNSGGPLIDTEGKVIGINNFKVSGSESLGFALESNYIKETVNNIYSPIYGGDLI
jgi:S1-C subfamily serine protease